ncbi:MAG TPA: DUF3159 domain-containing protein [Micromonosporaceae bacterium]
MVDETRTDVSTPPDDDTLPTFTEQIAEQLGGLRGILESSIPVTVFVVVNIVWTLRPALIISVASAVAIAVWRLARRQPIRHAVNGLFGIVIGVVIAWRTGNARDFYLPGIWLSLAYGVAMLASVAVRRPLVGWVWSVIAAGGSMAWREHPRLVRTFSWLTVLWAVVYLAKMAVQYALFAADQADALGVARLALGYPPYALLIAVTVWAVRRASRGVPLAEPAS